MNKNEMITSSNGFLVECNATTFENRNYSVAFGKFDANLFQPHLFGDLDIAHPLKIKRACESRQADFLAGRAMAKIALSTLDKGPECSPLMGPDRLPIWPEALSGSISHSGGYAACIVSGQPGCLVGIDVERVTESRQRTFILSKAQTHSDRDMQFSQSMASDAIFATLVFSAKETLFKALYPKVLLPFGFDAASLHALPANGYLRLVLTRDLAGEFKAGVVFSLQYRVDKNYVLTWLFAAPRMRSPKPDTD